MSKTCDICQKSYNRGNLVPRGIGHRVTRRTTHHQMPNLLNRRLLIGGTKIRATICAACLKRLKKDGVIRPYTDSGL
jgi:ribosomal protein L28